MAKTAENHPILKKSEITELKSLASPPVLVIQVLKTTAILLGHPEEYVKEWRYVQKILAVSGKDSLQNQLDNLDIKSIPPEAAMKAKEISKDIEGDRVKKNQNVINTVLANDDPQKSS